MDMKVSSTIGFERHHNRLLNIDDEQDFVDETLAALGPQPPNFKAIVALNKGPLVTAGVEIGPLTPRQVEEKRRQGALLVDVRTDLQFDEAHIEDSVSNSALRAGFGTKLAWIADRDQEIVLIGRDDEEAHRAALLAVAVGIRKLGGYLHGGMTVWRAEKRPVMRIERITIDELADADPPPQILDVREQSEWDEAHIPNSVHIPYHDIHAMPDELDPSKPIAAICASGQRSAVAASLLQRFGAQRPIHVVDGGVGTWARAGHPVERET
jgi:rhodanese-related sulfurtransferase